jgi:hypothetical protein
VPQFAGQRAPQHAARKRHAVSDSVPD